MLLTLTLILTAAVLAALRAFVGFARCVAAEEAHEGHESWLLQKPSATSYRMRTPDESNLAGGRLRCRSCGSDRLHKICHAVSYAWVRWSAFGLRTGPKLGYWSHVCSACGTELFRTREPNPGPAAPPSDKRRYGLGLILRMWPKRGLRP